MSTFFSTILLMMSVVSLAQQKVYLERFKNLDSLSSIYSEKGAVSFIVIDAYKAGLIKDGMDYSINFKDHFITLNGVLLPEVFMQTELDKIKQIERRENFKMGSFSVGQNADKTKKIFVYEPRNKQNNKIDANSIIEKEWKEHTDNQTELIRLLVDEKVITQPIDLYFSYNQKTILINGKKLNEQQVKRYLPVLVAINKLLPPEKENEFAGFDIGKWVVQEVMQ